MATEAQIRLPAVAALKHPMAIQIVVVANEQRISPTRFVAEFLRPKPKSEAEYEKALGRASYHFHALADAKIIELVEERPVRGAIEKFYAGVERAHFTDEQWAEIPLDQRTRISAVAIQGLVARIEDSMLAQVFDLRDDRWVFWTAAFLDEQGWRELSVVELAHSVQTEEIRRNAEARLAEREEEGIPTTFAQLVFESPRPGTRRTACDASDTKLSS